MNKTELIAKVSETSGLTKKDAETALNAITDTIAKELRAGGNVNLIGFGSFQVTDRAARTGRNPQTGAAIEIAASKLPTFKAGKTLKDSLN